MDMQKFMRSMHINVIGLKLKKVFVYRSPISI